jgi:hypothetical protein
LVTVAVSIGVLAGLFLWGTARLGPPIEAYRAYKRADEFMRQLRQSDYSAVLQMFSKEIRGRLRDEERTREFVPLVNDYHIGGIRCFEVEGLGRRYHVMFKITSPSPSELILKLSREDGDFVVVFIDPPGI